MDAERHRNSGQRREKDAEEAAGWFARWQAGTVDEDAFERWRADPANALAFARVTSAWEAVAGSGDVADGQSGVTRRGWLRAGIAGAVLVSAGTGVFASRAYAWERASTQVGETRKLRLSDGSMIALNTDTSISWRFSTKRRELWLERGEVAIELRSGPEAQLSTNASRALLDSGRFNARLRADALDLMVLRGRAATANSGSAKSSQLEANPFQRIAFSGAGAALRPVSRDTAEAALAWQSGDVVFLDTPLSEAVAEYNRYLLRKIVIEDAAIGAIRVGGRFVSSDPTDFLKAISSSLGVKTRTTATGYHLTN